MNSKGKGKGKDEKEEPATVKNPKWLELPEGIWANILQRVGAIEIMGTAEKVCTTWSRICKEPSMWRVIDMWNRGDLSEIPYDLEKMCRHAVDRSQGELIDINMEYFANDQLLKYVADRSGKLKRLSIACCYGMVCDGLVEVVQKLPFLEELSLTHTTITKEGIEALGRSCPRLKSFELNNSSYMGSSAEFEAEDSRNDLALDIAKNLPALHNLKLIANGMNNKGLLAILDGCPNLVSLDLRLCKNVRPLAEVLSSRISRIKDVKHPDDSLKGFTFGFEPWGSDEYNSFSDDDGIHMYDDDDIIGMYDSDGIGMYGDDMYSDYDWFDYY